MSPATSAGVQKIIRLDADRKLTHARSMTGWDFDVLDGRNGLQRVGEQSWSQASTLLADGIW